MSRTIKVATAQMDATPAPLHERLARAGKIVEQATLAGAQLVVLPELFNTGYVYSNENFKRAELIDGETSTWMKTTAARLGIHLAGTLMVLEQGDIYNSMLLFSPTGQMWRYNKNYPWAWERAYFRGRRGLTIANTELGDLGLMICWDLGHLNMWKQYAGKADMIVIASCPPDAGNAFFDFPNGEKLDFSKMGALDAMKDVGKQFFGEMVDQQAQWLGIPVVNSGASGQVRTHIPKAGALLRNFIFFAPRVIKLLSKAEQLKMSCEMIPSCKIVNANGKVIAERAPTVGEGFVIADVTLADSKITPAQSQPNIPLDPMTARMATFNADIMIPALIKSVYKNGLKSIRK